MTRSRNTMIGLIAGAIVGATVECLTYDTTNEHGVRIPVVGVVIGGLTCMALAYLAGTKVIRGWLLHSIVGLLVGLSCGVVGGALCGPVMAFIVYGARYSEKMEAHYRLIGIWLGSLIGIVLGGSMGLGIALMKDKTERKW